MDGRSISLSGLRINAAQLAASAQNIANANTPGKNFVHAEMI
jgi:flagellar hook protein FlgE